MKHKDKTLEAYIPDYLDFCRKLGLSSNTLKNYVRFLQSFFEWLRVNNLIELTPQSFSIDHVQKYSTWLSQRPNKTKKNGVVSASTKTRYLIVLRSFFSYLSEKRIGVGVFPQDIILPKLPKSSLVVDPVNAKTITDLCNLPKASTAYGLRDRALLGILLFTGLKVSQIVNLNREDILWRSSGTELTLKRINPLPHSHAISLPKKLGEDLRAYYDKRKDQESALFVRTSGPTNAPARLTVRSVERTVKKYTNQLGISAKTPELLRGVHNKDILIQQKLLKNYGIRHRSIVQTMYDGKSLSVTKNEDSKKELHWYDGEQAITLEVAWLKENILTMPITYRGERAVTQCDDCILHNIALLIVSGEIRATYIKSKTNEHDLWGGLTRSDQIPHTSRHGKEWHRKMIDVVAEYFKGCEQVSEPTLHYGRADLGIMQTNGIPIYVEVGTVSLFKLWYNLSVMKDAVFVLVPDENYVIEFRT